MSPLCTNVMKKGYQLLVTPKLAGLQRQRFSHQPLMSILLWLIECVDSDLKDELKDVSLEVVTAQYVGDGYPCLAIHYFNKENPQDVGPIVEAAVERLLQVEVLAIENEQEVFTAMVALRQGRGSFADALIAELGARAGCTRTLTFDQKALRLRGFKLV